MTMEVKARLCERDVPVWKPFLFCGLRFGVGFLARNLFSVEDLVCFFLLDGS